MPSLWIPNAAADALLEDQGHAEAKRFVSFRRRLKAMDARMDAFLCDSPGPDGELRAGWYYLTRRNDNGTTTFYELATPEGKFKEPGDDVIDALQKIDRDTLQDLRARNDDRKRRSEKRAQEKRELALAKFQDRADYTWRVQHAFPSLPWKQ